ncbi:hypothetical protein FRX31_019582 [Thalictrum thalictroides]|uniref:Uncharacterized protein n=1 Tax=Thalictrum thalictroides TaxID=46969 RepID=A0A7J6W0Z3_THATH|nr:hypothetical protein FRX31_019582 [Thalictrum thalictroides]
MQRVLLGQGWVRCHVVASSGSCLVQSEVVIEDVPLKRGKILQWSQIRKAARGFAGGVMAGLQSDVFFPKVDGGGGRRGSYCKVGRDIVVSVVLVVRCSLG